MTLPHDAFIDDEGVWNQIFTGTKGSSGGALFLDRDGVVVEEVHYLHKVDDIRLVPAAATVIAGANRLNVPVVIVTNQAGVGQGLYNWADFAIVQRHILDNLSLLGARIDAVYACPHHRDADTLWAHPDHPARKPNPGMLMRAATALGINLSSSWIIGDRAGDLEAGQRAGIAGGLHVMAGHGTAPGERDQALATGTPHFRAIGITDISEAPRHIPLLQGQETPPQP